MKKKVIFYTDQQDGGADYDEKMLHAILKYVGAEEVVYCNPQSTYGFYSGVEWERLAREGAVAVVLSDINDACACGIWFEAQVNAGLNVYQCFDGKLWTLKPMPARSKKAVAKVR